MKLLLMTAVLQEKVDVAINNILIYSCLYFFLLCPTSSLHIQTSSLHIHMDIICHTLYSNILIYNPSTTFRHSSTTVAFTPQIIDLE
jgi:hypothetical protein